MISGSDLSQYLGVLTTLIIATFGVPIPEEIPVATGGVLVGKEWNDPDSTMKWWIMLPICIIGVVGSDTILYLIGRKWGHLLVKRQWVQRRILPPAKLEKIKKNFDDYGIGILLVARLLPGIRTPIFMTAGMVRLPFYRFMIADALYAIPGVNFFFWMGYWFTDSFLAVLKQLDSIRELLAIAIISYIAGFLTSYFFVNRKVTTGDPNEIPVFGKPIAHLGHHLHHHEHGEVKPDGTNPNSPNPNPESQSPKPVPGSAPDNKETETKKD